jgi:hypothetical protein
LRWTRHETSAARAGLIFSIKRIVFADARKWTV